MFDIFKKKKDSNVLEPQNDFLSNEHAAFNTKSDQSNVFVDNTDYSGFTYQEPVYDVPEYKAQNLSNLGVVVDSTAVGFNKDALNPDIKIIDIPNNDELNDANEYEEPIELLNIVEPQVSINNSIKETAPEKHSIFEEPKVEKDVPVYKSERSKEPSISIFGSNDGVTNVNNYTSNNQVNEQKQELISEVEYTSNGYKICPKCGTILSPDAPVCFMCSKSFVKKM